MEQFISLLDVIELRFAYWLRLLYNIQEGSKFYFLDDVGQRKARRGLTSQAPGRPGGCRPAKSFIARLAR